MVYNVLNITGCLDILEEKTHKNNMHFIIIIIVYLYSAQYLHILQDSKRYLTNPTAQVQPQLTNN